ncbi:MAG: shikimate kinase [Thermodesulfovibrio sp.]|nr:shikimate kinase [Thermodesulfovibrio sp.]MDW7999041.1 shikimate kinase [Thermodesulfovibrio sp.]
MIKRPNIILIGFMGTGKSTVGKLVSEKLRYIFIDIDELIEKTVGMKISEIFKRFGEARFRDIETEMIKLLIKKRGQVISTGGGVVLREENMLNLKKSGILFCLKANENTIFERIKNCKNRPLIQVENPQERIKKLMDERRPFYEQADFVIDTNGLSPEEVAITIIKKYERIVNGKD